MVNTTVRIFLSYYLRLNARKIPTLRSLYRKIARKQKLLLIGKLGIEPNPPAGWPECTITILPELLPSSTAVFTDCTGALAGGAFPPRNPGGLAVPITLWTLFRAVSMITTHLLHLFQNF